MREIKFRAWYIDEKRFIDEFTLNYIKDSIGNKFFSIETPERLNLRIEDGIILMQFTGLKDKNGKEIYEGDIIRYNYHTSNRNGNTDFTGVIEYYSKEIEIHHEETLIVGFLFKGWCDIKEDYWFTKIPDVEDKEIIGNIYKNPELLK